jgi:hypothetical protein
MSLRGREVFQNSWWDTFWNLAERWALDMRSGGSTED